MARSSLRYVLPLAGLLVLAPFPASAGWGDRTVQHFIDMTDGGQIMFLSGALDAASRVMKIRCGGLHFTTGMVRDLILQSAKHGTLAPSDNFTEALVGTLLEIDCKPDFMRAKVQS